MSTQPIPVLIVDDDPSVGAWLQLLVRRMGETLPCVSTWVTTGTLALEEIQKKRYDLVFLDYHLQDLDGLAVLKGIKQRPREQQPAVIMLTGGGNEKIAVEAMKSGARDYLIKGNLDQATLRRTMAAALETRRLESELIRYTEELRLKNEQMEAELAMARDVQQALLPQSYPTIPKGAAAQAALRFAHHWLPSSGMAGDFFEILPFSDTAAGIFICDVMGHGVRAALVTALIRGLLEEASPNAADPGAFLGGLNRDITDILQRSNNMMFATAIYLVADVAKGEVRMANAGHPYPLLVKAGNGGARFWDDPGMSDPALGLIPDCEYVVHSLPMGAGDSIMLYTDGLYEAENAQGEAFGMERLSKGVSTRHELPAPEMIQGLLSDLRGFLNIQANATLADDVCVVSIGFP